MTVTEPLADQVGGQNTQALFKEARHRRRRRYLWSAATVVLLVSALAAGLRAIGPGASSRQAPARPTVQSLTFGGRFIPHLLVSVAGTLWLAGSTQPNSDTSCAMAEIDPGTLRIERAYPLQACAPSLVALGDSDVYLTYLTTAGHADGDLEVRIESFDTLTGVSRLMSPVDAILPERQSPMEFAYGQGSLWLHPWNRDLLELSPSTGAMVRTIGGAPPVSTGNPEILAKGSGLWLGGGLPGPAVVDRLAQGRKTPTQVYVGPPGNGNVLWFSAVGDQVWADIASYPRNGAVVTRLVVFDTSGTEIREFPPEQLGDTPPVGSGRQLWSIGDSATYCTGGPLHLLSFDRAGTSVLSTTLPRPSVTCGNLGPAQLAVLGHNVFVLDPTYVAAPGGVLYRIKA